jgi:hypothetical protein
MKVIISEQRINNVIEKLLMNNIEGIKSVNFFEKEVSAIKELRKVKYTKTVIEIVIDPGKVCEGNLYFGSHSLEKRKKIQELLNDTLSINVREFMSPYDFIVYEVVTTPL